MSFPPSESGCNSFLSRFPPANGAREVESPRVESEEVAESIPDSQSESASWLPQDETETPIPLKGYYAQFRYEHMPEIFGLADGVDRDFINNQLKEEGLLSLQPHQTRPVASIPSQFHRIICVLQYALQCSDGYDLVPNIMDKRIIKATGRKLSTATQEAIPGQTQGYNLCHRQGTPTSGLSAPLFDKDGDFVSFQNPVSVDKRSVLLDANGNEYIVVACRREHVSLLYNAGQPNAPPPKQARSLRGRNRRGNRVKTVVNTSDYVAGDGPLDGMLIRAGICPHAVSVFYFTSHGVLPIGGREALKGMQCTCNNKDMAAMQDQEDTNITYKESNSIAPHCVNGIYIHPYIRDIVNTENVNAGELQVNSGIGGHIAIPGSEEDKKYFTPRSNRSNNPNKMVLSSTSTSSTTSAGNMHNATNNNQIYRYNEWNENIGITDEALLKQLEPQQHDISLDPHNETNQQQQKMGIESKQYHVSAENPMIKNQLKHTLNVIEQQTKIHRDRAASTLQSNQRVDMEQKYTQQQQQKSRNENLLLKQQIKDLLEHNNTSQPAQDDENLNTENVAISQPTQPSPPHSGNLDFLVKKKHLNTNLEEHAQHQNSPLKRLRSPTNTTIGSFKRMVIDTPTNHVTSSTHIQESLAPHHETPGNTNIHKHILNNANNQNHEQVNENTAFIVLTDHPSEPRDAQNTQPIQKLTMEQMKHTILDDEKNFTSHAKDNMKMTSE